MPEARQTAGAGGDFTPEWSAPTQRRRTSPLHARYVEATGGVPFRDTPERIAIHAELGLPVVEDRSERLCEIFARLETRLIQTPAPDAKAALWKLDYLVGAHERSTDTPSWCKRFVAPIVADLRRFIGGEA